jgi:hypothetical protein
MTASEVKVVDGIKLLQACRYSHELCALAIVLSGQEEELLDSIGAVKLKEDVGAVVLAIKQALGRE